MRKHNPAIIHDSITHVPERAARIRNFNDFAADINASALPQWIFVTPNMVNDGHDTTIDYASSWLEWWLVPLLKDKRFNSGEGRDGTLVVLTFDENSVCFVHLNFKTIPSSSDQDCANGVDRAFRSTTQLATISILFCWAPLSPNISMVQCKHRLELFYNDRRSL